MRGQLAREIRSCEICRRGLVYAVVPTSGVTPEPPQMYGPKLNGGQKPAALAVWDRAIAEAAAAEETRLMELHMPPAIVLDRMCCPRKRSGLRSSGLGFREATRTCVTMSQCSKGMSAG